MVNPSPQRPAQQVEGAPPVVENPRARSMEGRPSRPRRIGSRIVRMDDTPAAPAAAGQNLMDPVPARLAEQPPAGPPPAQEEQQAVAAEAEKYVRLRLRVQDGGISVIGVRAVEGPLAQPEQIHAGLAYEVTVGQRRVGVGSVPDAGVSRSFPSPDPATPEQQGHNIIAEDSYEFSARVPQKDLPLAALPRTQVSVYRVKEEPPARRLGGERLGEQFDRELREVARLDGIRLSDLPDDVAREMRQALQ